MEFQGELKKLSKRNLERLKSRIIEDGFNVPFFVWEHQGNYMILDGHQRLKALVSLREDGYDMPLLPVAFIDAEDEADARKKLLAISSQYGEFDTDELSDWLDVLDESVAETLRLVDGDMEIPTSQEEIEDALVDPDPRTSEAGRLQKKWATAEGQLWQLGEHKILCGDATDPEQVRFLLMGGGERADLIFTDPPYGVSYTGVNNPNGSEWDMIENDDLRGDALAQFLIAAFKNMYDNSSDDIAAYVWYASSTHMQFEMALNATGFEVKQQIIWNKGMVLGHSDYHWAHEPMLYCRKKGQRTHWYGDRTNKTILRARRTELSSLRKEALIQIIRNLLDNSTNWEIALDVLERCGYPVMPIVVDVGRQSADIALGTNDQVGGAGDNGMMFGFATRDTSRLLPKAMVILQEFARAYDELRKTDPVRFKSDGKAQITGIYDKNMWLREIDTFTICYQNYEQDRKATDKIIKDMALKVMHRHGVRGGLRRFLINPTGRFEIGGFQGDAGMTGRKIVVDSYHGFAPVGGGAFSGKDPTKVDRSGAYMARWIAMELLHQHGLRWCQVQLSYSIGIEEPMAIYVTSDQGHAEAPGWVYERCTPARIIEDLRLLDKNYEEMAAFGHFT